MQPPTNGGEEQRAAQAGAVETFVDGLLAAEPRANVVVLGDLNEFEFEEPIQALSGEGGPLRNLTETLPEDERYSYVYEGNSQSLDHILATPGLAAAARLDAVHVNSEFAGAASDHDPLLARFNFGDAPREHRADHDGRGDRGAPHEHDGHPDPFGTDWALA